MSNLIKYSSGLKLDDSKVESRYVYLDGEIKKSLKRSAGELVLLGHYLRVMKDEEVWCLHYRSFRDYLERELHIDPTLSSRFIAANKKYSVNGTVRIDEKWKDYSQGVLIEMLNMPPDLEKKITPNMTVREVRDLKRQARKDSEGKGRQKKEKVVKSQCPELVEPNQFCMQYLNDFAKYFISCHYDYFHKYVGNGFLDIETIPGMIKDMLKPQCRSWAFCSDGGVGHINLFEDCVQLWDKCYNFLGDFDWIYLVTAIQIMWDEAKRNNMPDAEYQELDPVEKVATSQLSDPDPELQLQENEPDHTQPDLSALKNNDQRKDWLRSYKDWGLWYRDDHIGVEYYKYDFDNGARLIVEVFQEENEYVEKYEVEYYHLVGGPAAPKVNGMVRWTVRRAFSRIPNSETELVEFLKYLQKKK